ncbi:MAG: GrpB family protein [Frankia sp.]
MIDPIRGARSASDAKVGEPVQIVDPDPTWPAAFAAEAARILAALGPHVLAIEHVGSTAVAGLAAKPVIDIQVGVRSLEPTPDIVARLTAIGYAYVPEFEDAMPYRRYFRRQRGRRRTHQIHVVERTNTDWWDRHVAFRDWLAAHPGDRDAYASLKRRLAAEHRDDRHAYTDAKSVFITRIVETALTARGREPGPSGNR